jgi:Protein of unknown function (DUF3987)
LSNILGRYNKGDATDEDFYCACFSGTPITVRRKSSEPLNLEAPCLTILVMVQPDVWDRLAGMRNMSESGFLPRLLVFDTLAEPELLPPTPHEIPDQLLAEYSAAVRALVDHFRLSSGEAYTFGCDFEAYDHLRDFDNECRSQRRTGKELHDIAAFAARWPEQAWRLSVVLHGMKHGVEAFKYQLAKQTALEAIELTRWFAGQQLNLLGAIRVARREERAEKLSLALQRYGGRCTIRDLRGRHGFSRDEILGIAHEFPGTFQVTTASGGVGRPSEVVTLVRIPS